MVTREQLEGKWTQLKGQIREKWGQITDDDLQRSQGNAEQLLGLLEAKTGESRKALEQFVTRVVGEGQSMVDRATEATREYAQQATRAVSDQYQQLEEGVEMGVHEAQAVVRARPMESLTAAFGAGLVAGVVISLMLRSSRT